MSPTNAPSASPSHPAAIRPWLVETLHRLAPEFGTDIPDDTPIAEHGLSLDSLALIELLAAIEDRFGLQVAEDEITVEHFGTVRQLLDFLSDRLPASPNYS